MTLQLTSVWTKRGNSRAVSKGNHVTENGEKSLCGRPVAVVQNGTPSTHTIGCTTCFTRAEKKGLLPC